jgi:hypothetical protein
MEQASGSEMEQFNYEILMSFHYTTELTFSFDAKPTEAVKIIIIFEK